jgi:CxxC motif-containing protein (DUF1111 family)
MKTKLRVLMIALLTSGVVLAQVRPPPGGPPPGPQGPQGPQVPQPVVPAQGFGQSLLGLTNAELAAFREGRAAFLEAERPEEGLGPIFNGRSCVQCHGVPAAGGSSPINVTRFGRVENGVFDPLTALGGSLLQRFSLPSVPREVIPPAANVVAERESPALFGLGLIEAIPDAAILANAATPKPDGVRGRAAMVGDVTNGQIRVGRFGWKAQHATLLAFSADAYLNEMGITNRFFPIENAPNGNRAALVGHDPIADPEDPAVGRGDTDALADFMRLLAPPAPLALTASAQAGQTLFASTGCAACHTPSYTTGTNPIAALSNKRVDLYSDLLLHDMGTLGDGIAQAAAGMREMRTPPLWGLRASAPYLHDGRASTLDQAIRLHEGEAAVARNRYNGLTAAQRRQLLDFLGSL